MHRQHFHLILRSHLGLVEIDVVPTGTAAVQGRAHVKRGGRVRRELRCNRANAVRHAWELAKQLYQLRVRRFDTA